jgi:plasmid stability protein
MAWIKRGIQYNASSASIESVATITIRGLDEAVKKRLRARAVRHGRSMEEEAREILKIGVATSEREPNLAESIRALFEPLGGVDLPEFRDKSVGDPIRFDE